MSSRSDEYQEQANEPRQDALAPGQPLLGGQYRIERFLASGGFGVTYLAIDSLDRKVVIKECYPDIFCCREGTQVRVRNSSMTQDFELIVRHFKREALRMAKLSHPNIVGVHQVFEDNGTAYMALDYIEGRDLMGIIETDRHRIPADAIKALLIKMLEAVGYVHEHGVLHRDISPDNILVDRTGKPILIDFGAAHDVSANSTRVMSALQVVKDGYSPQESYLSNASQNEASDLYSLAATFYHLITGEAPPDSQARLAAIASERPDPCVPISPHNSPFDHFFLRAIDKALSIFPEDRPQTAADWIALIEEKRRREALMLAAQRDKQVELDIKFLTEETNREIVDNQKSAPTAAPKPRRVNASKRPAPAQVAPDAAAPTPARANPTPTRTDADDAYDLSGFKPRRKRSLVDRIFSTRGSLLGLKAPAGTRTGGRGA